MKNYKKILWFLFIGIIIAYCINSVVFFAVKKSDIKEFGIWNDIVSGRINADILFVGSSRTLVNYDCNLIESILNNQEAYNIGMDGSRLNLQLPRLMTYLAHNKKPFLVILSLDIQSLVYQKDVYDFSQYIPYLNQEYLYRNLRTLRSDAWMYKYIPLYGFSYGEIFREAFVNGMDNWIKGNKNELDKTKGFRPQYKTWNNDFENFKNQNEQGKRIEIQKQAINELVNIINILKSKEINLLIVYTPEYYENYDLILNRNEIFTEFQNIANKYNILFWDYSGLSITKEKEVFYNSQHLNANGAKIFSLDIASRIKEEYFSDKVHD